MPFPFPGRFASGLALAAVCCAWLLSTCQAAAADSLDDCATPELELYLALAKAAETAYDDSRPGLESTPSGCVALIGETGGGDLVIAFRGSMLGDRDPKHRFSGLGGANIRRNYRDWLATNLKQAAGFLPRQYVEAAALAEKHVRAHPADRRVFVVGHSKGGGAAAYAFVAAVLSPKVSDEQAARLRCVTFNAAVVAEQNWRRLRRGLDRGGGAARREPAAGSIVALCMRDDPVSRIAASRERPYARRIVIAPTAPLSASEQHGIGVVIDELEKARGRRK